MKYSIKLRLCLNIIIVYDTGISAESLEPIQTIVGKTFYTSIDHHHKKPVYATSGECVDVWDETHLEPIKSYSWGVDSHYNVKFNPVETNILASCAADRSIILYDIRQAVPVRKTILTMSSNAICWNPLEAMLFTVANEDTNLYTFDMRKLDKPLQVHMDHVAAVMSLDYSPTGTTLPFKKCFVLEGTYVSFDRVHVFICWIFFGGA